jgi:homoserine/homoserine lactone efflux protein
MSLHFLLLFTATVFIASIIPGPSMLLALSHGMQYGARRTIASALGNVTVTLIQALISIVGLGAVLLASETVFHTIKWIGAAYLIGIGISILRANELPMATGGNPLTDHQIPLRRLFMQAALVTAGNPKAIVFFTAIFPQFIDPTGAYLAQSLVLMGICAAVAFCCFMLYAMGGQKIVSLFSQARVARQIKRLIGTTFIGSGLGLAASNR